MQLTREVTLIMVLVKVDTKFSAGGTRLHIASDVLVWGWGLMGNLFTFLCYPQRRQKIENNVYF